MKKLISLATGASLAAFLVLGHSTPAFAPADMFLKIGDIKGESTDSAHKDEIEILSWSWGETTYPRAVGERVMQPEMGAGDLTVTKMVDRATPLLMNYCATGKPMPSVTVFQGSMTYKLTDVRVKCGATRGTSDDRPTEEVAFSYAKIKFIYKKEKKEKRDKYKKDRKG